MPTRLKIILWSIVILSAVPRLLFPNQPLLERHGWRQTQTAIAVRSMLESGIKWLDYETPIFGPPWRMPMEFPTFQASAAMLIRATGMPIDMGCRMTNVLYFYVSAWLLFLIVRRCLVDPQLVVCVMGVYLVSPYTIVWSRTSMIEFAAVAFGLGYLYAVLRWADRPSHVWWVAVAAACGALTATTKVTTFAAVAPAAAVFGLMSVWRQPWGVIARRMPALLIMTVVPLIAGAEWVHYSDAVKAASPFTAFLTSRALSDWNYGTLNQRMSLKEWYVASETTWKEILPFGIAVLPFVAGFSMRAFGRDARLLLIGSIVGTLLPIIVFFNLYLAHDYYECAITPCLAVLAGCGLAVVIRWARESRRRVAAVVVVGAVSLSGYVPFLVAAYTYNDSFYRVGKALEQHTPAGESIIVTGNTWNAVTLYYANRRGCLLHWEDGVDWRTLPLERFTTVSSTTRDHRVTSWYARHELVDQVDAIFIYRVQGPLAYP